MTEIQNIVLAAARQHAIEPALLLGLVEQESAFNPAAKSHEGALGLCQLMPRTAAELGITDPLDPHQNALGGARYLAAMLSMFSGDRKLALWAYNWGPGNVRRYGLTGRGVAGQPMPVETQQYSVKVLANRDKWIQILNPPPARPEVHV